MKKGILILGILSIMAIVLSGIFINAAELTLDINRDTVTVEEASPRAGLKFVVNLDGYIISVEKDGASSADRAYLYVATDSDSGNLLATATFSGNTATFNYPINTSATYFALAGANSGGNYFRTYDGSGITDYPFTNDNINITSTVIIDAASFTNNYRNIFRITTNTTFTPEFTTNITLVSPSNVSSISTNGTNFTANFTISDGSFGWNNATYNVWYSNGTILNSTNVELDGTNETNYTLFIDNFILGNYIWGITGYYNNSTFSNHTISENFTFMYRPFSEGSYSYNNSVFETSNQSYTLNISSIETATSFTATFFYNGTQYNPTTTDLGSGNYLLNNTIDVPLQNSSGNKTFYWFFNFTLEDDSYFETNSTIFSQEVNRTILTLCNATYPIQFINLTTNSAENPFPRVNATFKSAWSWFLGGGSVSRNYTFEDVTEVNSSWAFCGNYNETFITDGHFEYDSTGYSLNSYYLEDAELTNTTNYINLYLLNESKSTITVLKVRDSIQNPMEDVLIQIQLYDVGTDAFYTVGMGKTSFQGEDVAYLNWYDSLYKFILIKDGEVIKSTNTTRIAETPQIFDIESETTFSFTKFRDFEYDLYYNNVTQNFVLTYTKPSGLVDQACLRITKRTASNDTQISLQCLSTTSGTLYSNIAAYGNGTYLATFYATGSWFLLETISEQIGGSFASGIFNSLSSSDRLLYTFLMSLVVIVMFAITPVLGIIGGFLGILASSALGFQLLEYSAFILLILTGGGIIWFVKR